MSFNWFKRTYAVRSPPLPHIWLFHVHKMLLFINVLAYLTFFPSSQCINPVSKHYHNTLGKYHTDRGNAIYQKQTTDHSIFGFGIKLLPQGATQHWQKANKHHRASGNVKALQTPTTTGDVYKSSKDISDSLNRRLYGSRTPAELRDMELARRLAAV